MTRPLAAQAAVHGDEMVEEMRRMLLETNPWLLGLTMAVSLLHSLFVVFDEAPVAGRGRSGAGARQETTSNERSSVEHRRGRTM